MVHRALSAVFVMTIPVAGLLGFEATRGAAPSADAASYLNQERAALRRSLAEASAAAARSRTLEAQASDA
uniref:hypothetical protein n=1 Tax=Blastomonas sp. TaxID=1909299 RepID=UPI0035948440